MIFRPHRENLLLFRGKGGKEREGDSLPLLTFIPPPPSSFALNSFPFHTDISMPLPSSAPYSQKRKGGEKERALSSSPPPSESRGRRRRRRRRRLGHISRVPPGREHARVEEELSVVKRRRREGWEGL